jgi:hypothetical protein
MIKRLSEESKSSKEKEEKGKMEKHVREKDSGSSGDLGEKQRTGKQPDTKARSKQYLEMEERVTKRTAELRELQAQLSPMPESGAKVLQCLRLAPFPLALNALQRTHHSITKMQLIGSEKALQSMSWFE